MNFQSDKAIWTCVIGYVVLMIFLLAIDIRYAEAGAYVGVLGLLCIPAFVVYRCLKFGGIAGAAFGARIERIVGEIRVDSVTYGETVVRVYLLDPLTGLQRVGIETDPTRVARSVLGNNGRLALTRAETRELIKALRHLAAKQGGDRQTAGNPKSPVVG